MNLKNLLLAVLLTLFSGVLLAQETSIFTEMNLAYKRGIDFYQKGLFGQAQKEFEKVIQTPIPPDYTRGETIKADAELKFAQSALRLNHPDSEILILSFIAKHSPGAKASQAMLEMGNYYYAAKDYERATTYYQQVDVYGLDKKARTELKFKQGYSAFVRKKFGKANRLFKDIINTDGKYREPASYYYGLTEFFANRYDKALTQFDGLVNSRRYGKVVPYYVAQIHFAKGNFDKVITHSEPFLKSRNVKYRKEISHLVGKSYFEKKEYKKALPYLEAYSNASRKMSEEDIYQLAFTQYKNGKYKKAIKNFEQLNKTKSKLGQNALYNLGASYVKTDDKVSARNAFDKARRMKYDPEIKEEATYNYAKLSYELKYDREAIAILQNISPSSAHYNEAQEMMGNIFLNTRDYDSALKILEKMPNKTPRLYEIYQKVTYFRGVQMYNDGNYEAAINLFNRSKGVGGNQRTKALSSYWLGDIYHKEEKYDKSIQEYNEFLTLAPSAGNLPDGSSAATAKYGLGYNYIKKKNYRSAQRYFEEAITEIKNNFRYIKEDAVKDQVYPDAIVRAADASLKRNQYDKAMEYYDFVISNDLSEKDYAMYQKAVIMGLQGQKVDKILLLEEIKNRYPNSDFADDALLQLGLTYQGMGKLNEATAAYDELIKKKKNSPQVNKALLQMGLISFNQDQNEKALSYYKQVFSNNPQSAEAKDALKGIEEIYIDMGNPDGYIAFVESVPGAGVTVSGTQRDAINFKAAEAKYQEGEYQEAINAYSKYIKNFPNGVNLLSAYFQRAESYLRLDRYDDALPDYEYVVSKGKSHLESRALRKAALISLQKNKDYNKAYRYFVQLEKVAEEEDVRYEAQIGAMKSAYELENKSGVKDMALKVLSNPKSTKADQGEASYYLGKMALAEEKLEEAREYFNTTVKSVDNAFGAEARYQIAYIYYVMRELDMAQALCLNTTKEIPSYQYWVVSSIILLGDIFSEKGDYFNARASLESVVETYKGDPELLERAKRKLARLDELEKDTNKVESKPEADEDLEMDESDMDGSN